MSETHEALREILGAVNPFVRELKARLQRERDQLKEKIIEAIVDRSFNGRYDPDVHEITPEDLRKKLEADFEREAYLVWQDNGNCVTTPAWHQDVNEDDVGDLESGAEKWCLEPDGQSLREREGGTEIHSVDEFFEYIDMWPVQP
jgi:hypothetical protein